MRLRVELAAVHPERRALAGPLAAAEMVVAGPEARRRRRQQGAVAFFLIGYDACIAMPQMPLVLAMFRFMRM